MPKLVRPRPSRSLPQGTPQTAHPRYPYARVNFRYLQRGGGRGFADESPESQAGVHYLRPPWWTIVDGRVALAVAHAGALRAMTSLKNPALSLGVRFWVA